MAYLTPATPRRRMVTAGAVVAVHGAMALAIMTGFAGGLIRVIEKHTFPTRNYPQTQPPEPQPSPEPNKTPISHPRETIPETTIKPPSEPFFDREIRIDRGPVGPIGGGLGETLTWPQPEPTPSPTPSFAPRAVRALTEPGRWVSENDYPINALRRGEQGVTSFAITIGVDGRVRDCTVTGTSGSRELDAATCAKVSQRARFTPARDRHGEVAVGRYTNSIRWQIPE